MSLHEVRTSARKETPFKDDEMTATKIQSLSAILIEICQGLRGECGFLRLGNAYTGAMAFVPAC